MAKLYVGRVVMEDSDTITLEVAKRDDFAWEMKPEKEANRFYILAFVRVEERPDGTKATVTWDPFE
jgi:hypothetical protein